MATAGWVLWVAGASCLLVTPPKPPEGLGSRTLGPASVQLTRPPLRCAAYPRPTYQEQLQQQHHHKQQGLRLGAAGGAAS